SWHLCYLSFTDSLEESVATLAGRFILFGTILTTILDATPTVTPPTTHITTVFGALRRRVMILTPGQSIPHGRSYRYHPNRPVHMMTMRKRVGPLATHRLAVRHSVHYYSSDPFTFDDSSETSSDSSLDDLSDSSSGHSSLDHSSSALPSGTRSSHQLCLLVPSIPYSSATITKRPSHSSFTGPYRKRSRSPTTTVPRSSPIPGALSPTRADLLPPPKRIRSSNSATDLKDCLDESFESSVPRETSLRDVIVFRGSDEPYSEPDTDPEIQAEINECIAYADALRAEWINARLWLRLLLERRSRPVRGAWLRFHDHAVEIPVHGVQFIKSIQMDQGHRIVTTGQQSAVLSKKVSELERDNTRLRGTLEVMI
nr:hypothetical protein [Tanacetum cinerariifolium]